MLSSVVRSQKAVRMNIEIMRAFVRLRRASAVSSQVIALVEDLARRVDGHDLALSDLVESLRSMIVVREPTPNRPIGFTADIESPSE